MKSNDDLQEFLGVLSDTQFYYSEVCLTFAQLESKKWKVFKNPILIPSVANDQEIKEIEKKADEIDFNLPNDNEEEEEESINKTTGIRKSAGNRVFQHAKLPRARKLWTTEEVDALKDGILKIGVGKWLDIYKLHIKTWRRYGRTTGDIKDKYRRLREKADFQLFLTNNNIQF